MASRISWLANHTEPPNLADGYTIRSHDGNPVGLPHLSQYSGTNVTTLSSTSFKFGINSLAVAKSNSAKLQALIDGLPDSGGTIQIPHDIALTTIKLPTRTIRGIPGQPINFRLCGTRPGVQIYGLSTEPLFTLINGPSGVVHTPTRTALCELRDLGITCRGTGVHVEGAGLYFTAHNVEVRSEAGPAWLFRNCYGLHLGRVGAFNGQAAIGFLFDSCIHISFGHLWSRGNRIGVEVKNSDHGSGNFFGTWDCEGNNDFQVKLDGLQKSFLGLYMESQKRMSLKNCGDLDFVGDGFRVDECDEYSRLNNPKLFDVERTPMNLESFAQYSNVPAWKLETLPGLAFKLKNETTIDNGWVRVFDWLKPGFYEISFQTRGTPTGGTIGYFGVNSGGWFPGGMKQDCNGTTHWSQWRIRGEVTVDSWLMWMPLIAGAQVEFRSLKIVSLS